MGSPESASPISSSSPQRPVVTIVIPVFNGGGYLTNAIASVAGQDLKNLEIIAIDDGSTDASVRVIESWAQRDGRILLLKNGINRGISFTLNRGIAAATGRYLLIMHQDCALIGRDWLTEATAKLERSTAVGLVASPRLPIDRMAGPGKWFWVIRNHLYSTTGGDVVQPKSPLFSENKCDMFRLDELVKLGGFNATYRHAGEDFELGVRLRREGRSLAYLGDLSYELMSGDETSLLKALHREFRYGGAARRVLLQTRFRAVARSEDRTLDRRLVNRASSVGAVLAVIVGLIVALVISPLGGVMIAFAGLLWRAAVLAERGYRVRTAYRLKLRDLVSIIFVGLVADWAYVMGFLGDNATVRIREAPLSRSTSEDRF